MRKLTIALVSVGLAAFAFGGCGGSSPGVESAQGEQTSPTDRETLSSCELVELAVRQGRLDYGTGLLYKVYSIYEPMSLPEEFQSDTPAKCGTPIIVEVQRNWQRLSPEQRAEIERYVDPLLGDDDEGTDLDDVGPERPEHGRGGVD